MSKVISNNWWNQNKNEYQFSRKIKKINFKLDKDQKQIKVGSFSKTQPNNKLNVITAIPGIDMRYSHNGLCYVAKQKGIDPDKITPGNYIVFINPSWTMCKILTTGRIVLSAQAPKGKLHWSYIENLPKAFGANGAFDFNKAVRAGILQTIEKQKEKRQGLNKVYKNLQEYFG